MQNVDMYGEPIKVGDLVTFAHHSKYNSKLMHGTILEIHAYGYIISYKMSNNREYTRNISSEVIKVPDTYKFMNM